MINRAYQPAFTSGELSPALCARTDLQKYDAGAKLLLNMEVRPEGGASRSPGTRFVADTGDCGRVRLIPFTFSMEQSYILEFTAGRIRVVTAEGVVLDGGGSPVTVPTPYAESELFDLAYAQNADVIYLAHPAHPPYKLLRRAHGEWGFEQVAFLPKIAAPQGLAPQWHGDLTQPMRVWRYRVTAVDQDSGEESLPSPEGLVTGAENMLVSYHNGSYMVADRFVSMSWAPVENANEYRVYKELTAGSGVYGYIGASAEPFFEDRNIRPNAEDSPPVESNPFAGGNHPACVTIHQQRLVFANSAAAPNTIWMSRSGNFENFTKALRVKADDYIEARLASGRVNPIVWLVGLRELVVGTSGAVWGIQGGGGNGALAPGAINASLQNARGSARSLRPVVIDNSILHVDRNRNTVRDLQYSFSSDSYRGTERSLFASHLFSGRSVVDLAYQESPHSIVWFVMSDGLLLGLTWVLEHEVFAWHRHETDGAYEAVCTIPGQHEDETFFVVRREIAGRTARYIEKLESRFSVPENYESLGAEAQHAVLARAFYVHSGLSWQGEARRSFAGLEHLEGKEVAILADGAVHPPLRVEQGRVELRAPASSVHIGLPYRSVLETVSFEPSLAEGVAVGRRKRIARVTVNLKDSGGVEVGINGVTVATKSRSTEPYGAPPRLRGGLHTYNVPGSWGTQSSVTVACGEPTPFTVLSVVPEVSTS